MGVNSKGKKDGREQNGDVLSACEVECTCNFFPLFSILIEEFPANRLLDERSVVRFILNSAHTEEHIAETLQAVSEVVSRLG